MSFAGPQAILFDLDGTLADTALDLVAALNRVRAELGFDAVPSSQVRPWISKGGAAILRAGVPEFPDAPTVLIERFLAVYREHLCDETTLFPGLSGLLERIERAGRRWGIVTNKPGWLTTPLLSAMRLDRRAGVVVSGDTLPVKKPDPGPVLHACTALGVPPARAILIGDDERDVLSARRAGATSATVGWGYYGPGEDPRAWSPDHHVASADELSRLLALP
jgi:N-acetyl-D-muramate 6-phosphate phosphatase